MQQARQVGHNSAELLLAARDGVVALKRDQPDQEHATELLKGKVGPTGRPAGAKGTPGVPFPSKGGTDRRAAQLATRRPDLAEAVRSGIERSQEPLHSIAAGRGSRNE